MCKFWFNCFKGGDFKFSDPERSVALCKFENDNSQSLLDGNLVEVLRKGEGSLRPVFGPKISKKSPTVSSNNKKSIPP